MKEPCYCLRSVGVVQNYMYNRLHYSGMKDDKVKLRKEKNVIPEHLN